MALEMSTDIQYLKGIGEKRAMLFRKLHIGTVGELISYYPRSYIDFTHTVDILTAPVDTPVTIRATLLRKSAEQHIRKGLSVFKLQAVDGEGTTFTITYFNAKYTVEKLRLDTEYLFYGKVSGTLLKKEMHSPMVLSPEEGSTMQPVYALTAGLTSKGIGTAVRQALSQLLESITETLPAALKIKYQLCHLQYAVENIHFPADPTAMEIARRRLIFEELFTLALSMAAVKETSRLESAARMHTVPMEPFYASLPFVLTDAQQRVVNEILSDLMLERPMNRLVQGDVGSGKTAVAAAACYFAIQNGMQAAMMAPTEILAEQHFQTLRSFLTPLGIRVGLLTGSTKAKEKNSLKAGLADGELQLVVGTHALLSGGIDFANLGLVITDEQHRFGVGQRIALGKKGQIEDRNAMPHTLVMSATPIPRTLALIIYGDLDVSVIDTLPVGRIPIRTYTIDSAKRQRAFGFIKQHLDDGYQAYIVCPLVEAGEVDLGLIPAVEYAQKLQEQDFAAYRVGLLHGKMKAAEKERVMAAFKAGELQLLVSTTVIEVGVDVPNAVIMLIENAERFGLSQLHQLRGRVGRGSIQSHCILVSDSRSQEARARLRTMCRTTSGFTVAEQDLAMRGPGDFFGARQHGLPQLQIADLAKDIQLLTQAQEAAATVLQQDPHLRLPEHRGIRKKVAKMLQDIGQRPN